MPKPSIYLTLKCSGLQSLWWLQIRLAYRTPSPMYQMASIWIEVEVNKKEGVGRCLICTLLWQSSGAAIDYIHRDVSRNG